MSVKYPCAAALISFTCALLLTAHSASAQQSFLQVPPPTPTSAIRNNYTGFVGLKITIGGTPLYVTQLARYFLPGSTGSHIVKLVNAQTGVDVPNGSVVCSPPSAQGGYGITYFPTAITLNNLSSYLIVSQETAGGDSWYDYAPVSYNGYDGTTLPAAVYQDYSGNYISVANSAGEAYGPVNFYFEAAYHQTSVTLTSPTEGSVLSGSTTTLSATVTPGTGVTITGVQFLLRDANSSSGFNINFGPVLTQPPYTLQLPTAGLTPGPHTVGVIATDSNGHTASDSTDVYGPGLTTLLTNFSPNNPRNDFSGYVGLAFTVAVVEKHRLMAPT